MKLFILSFIITGAITAATLVIDADSDSPANSDLPANQVRDRSALLLVLDGVTTGGVYTSITWTRNGTTITNMNPVPGVPNSAIFIGGANELRGGNPCSERMYRPAIQLNGYLPGAYQYTVDNDDTPGAVQSPTLSISGTHFNNTCVSV